MLDCGKSKTRLRVASDAVDLRFLVLDGTVMSDRMRGVARACSMHVELPTRVGTWRHVFFTVNLLERDRTLLTGHVDALRAAFRSTRKVRPFDVLAMVVLPDHLHCVWRLPLGDAENATRSRQIKTRFSKALPRSECRSTVRVANNERGIWQRRYREHLIRDDRDLAQHVDYVHINPVKHGYTTRIAAWPYSSFHRPSDPLSAVQTVSTP